MELKFVDPRSLKDNPDKARRSKSSPQADALLREVAGMRAVLAATADGFELAAALAASVDTARLAALSSSIAAIGEVVSAEAGMPAAS